jgi:hypothetical protein
LGDLVLLNLNKCEKNEILMEYPNSIGSKYIIEKKINNNNNNNNIDVVVKIVLKHIEQYLDLLPKNIADSTVIHLRLGDVVAGNKWYEKRKRPLQIDHIKSLVANDTNPKYIIGKCHFGKTGSTNYEECCDQSNEYLQNAITELHAEHFNSENADIDLCCAVMSKLFIQGKGYFSKLIVEIRKKLNKPNIETTIYN